jgi:two-component system NtrC family sensor kinase
MLDMVEESLEGVERIKRIVASLKSFSRKDENVLADANLNELIESTLTIVWNEIKYVATLAKELGDIPLIKCYPAQLNQVIMNLLVNAGHAIEKQGDITVRTWHDGDNAFFSVADTGCGIPEANLQRIFEPFFTTKETGKGTGLGLSIVYEIVRKHNGTIQVESEPGRGTTFTVSLPAGLD